MKAKIKEMFEEEENKINQITKELNEAENIEKKSELAEVLLLVVNNALDKLDKKFKIHKDYDAYKKILLARKDTAESIIKMKEKNLLSATSAMFNAFKRLLRKREK